MKRLTFTLIIIFTATVAFANFSASVSSQNHYVPGTTMDLFFELNYTSTDFEYGDYIKLTFPTGITPNSSPTDPFAPVSEGQGTEPLNGVSGQDISWGSNNNDGWGGIEIGVHSFIVNVTIDSAVAGNQIVNILVSGSVFGTPGPDLYITCTLQEMPAGPDLGVIGSSLEYTYCPLAQAVNLPVSGTVRNLGLDLTTATNLNVTCSLATYADSSNISIPLSTGGNQSFTLTGINALVEGTHEIVYNTTALNDPYLFNNFDTLSIEVDSVYAHDDGGLAYVFGHQSFAYRLGSVFDIVTPDDLTAVQFYLGQSSPIGLDFSLTVCPITINGSNATLGNPSWQSDTLVVTQSMLNTWTTVNVLNGALLNVDKYALIINEHGAGSIDLGFDGNPKGDIYRAYPGGADYLEDETFGYPMLRMVLGTINSSLTITDLDKNKTISIFPNLTTGIVNIRNAEKQNILVYDMQGKKVIEINNASNYEILDFSKNAIGTYIVIVGSKIERITLVK
jgi:hypothetical protein